jgi:hypothetical protein
MMEELMKPFKDIINNIKIFIEKVKYLLNVESDISLLEKKIDMLIIEISILKKKSYYKAKKKVETN